MLQLRPVPCPEVITALLVSGNSMHPCNTVLPIEISVYRLIRDEDDVLRCPASHLCSNPVVFVCYQVFSSF